MQMPQIPHKPFTILRLIITWMFLFQPVTGQSFELDDIFMLSTAEGSNSSCPLGYFQCNATFQCVSQRLNCDGSVDCDDGSDEWNCVNDIDDMFWNHLFRKQPYGLNDDQEFGMCGLDWNSQNSSCLCRGYDILCRFQDLTEIPLQLPTNGITMLDLTGNSFTNISSTFMENLPMTEILVLKFCGISTLSVEAFQRLSFIPIKTLYLDENRIESISGNLFTPGNVLNTLILSGNRIEHLDDNNFQNLGELIELDLRNNQITTIRAKVFEPLINLKVLHLNNNYLSYLGPMMFPTMKNLQTLFLVDNQITHIEKNTFGFPNLRYLFLTGNQLTEIQGQTFCPLHLLQGLHLNNNRLRKFDVHAFDCLENLTSLFLNDNDFQSLDNRTLKNLTNLEYIYFSWFHLCHAARHVRVCEPHGDGISSFYNLLDNSILRGSVWAMAIIAIFGNILVLVGRYFFKKTRSNAEHSLYLKHLAGSDLLMGIYLGIIACADISFRGNYLFHEASWRRSRLCAFSGFLNTFSCQSSTLMLTLVTWDRLMSVVRPLQAKDNRRKRIILRLLALWSVSFVLAAAPLFPLKYFGSHFYGTNGVCLSLLIHDPFAKGWEYSAILFIFVNTFSLCFILISYLRMLQAIRVSGDAMRSTLSGRGNMVGTRFAIIIATDCACWVPVIVVKILALSGISISPSLYGWLAVLVLPVNSALNPILYTLTTAVFKQQLCRFCHALPKYAVFLNRTHSQLTFESASTSLGQYASAKSNSGRKRCSNRRISYV
ncbi:leucine-rich repeat-containing G protein-coupled receptor 4 [Musca autumnalis]|uniref:leucine-rich repeat-containing G protein-coupled receptor 4 n=1 Tax=Musca autumnalis TaxID=221902 RepID=UPI003CE6AFC6